MVVVDTLPEYRSILHHSPYTLRAILRIELGAFITCRTLFDTVCTVGCERCGKSADYVDLLTSNRVCHKCLSYSSTHCAITIKSAA
jgi:hypothetical protein